MNKIANDMAREEGTYILLVDVFNGQDALFFPLSYHIVTGVGKERQ